MKDRYPLPWRRVNARIIAANDAEVCDMRSRIFTEGRSSHEDVANQIQDICDRAEVIVESVNSIGSVVMENMRLLRGGRGKE